MANYVTVTASFIDEQVNPCSGYVTFTPTDLAQVNIVNFPSSLGALAEVTEDLNVQGNISVPLLAMDNTGITGFSWIVSGRVNAFVIPKRQLTINFAAGATQDLRVLIAAGTLVT